MKNIYAAIDVGSNNIKLKIVQYIHKEMAILEDLSKPVTIGEGVFANGYVEHESVQDIVSILEVFKQIMDGYEVEHYKAVATSAMRVAQNGRNVVELIYMKTGIKVEIIEDTMEKYLTYKSMRDNVLDYKKLRTSTLLVELNTGSCDISIYSQNALMLSEEFILGTLILKNIMQELEIRSGNYTKAMHELIESRTSHIWQSIKVKKIKHFVAIGGEVRLMRKYIFNNEPSISKHTFAKVYDRVIDDPRTYRKEIEAYGMDWYEFVSSVLIYYVFFNLLKTDTLLFPEINLRDGTLAELIEKDHQLTRYQVFRNDTLTLARSISKRYRVEVTHCRYVEKLSYVLFRSMRTNYAFEDKDEILLRVSAILHEIGKYTRMKDYHIASFQKIKNLNIVGLTQEDMLMTAYISRFMKGDKPSYDEFSNMSLETHSKISKLSAILGIADALDTNKTQKISVEEVVVTDDYMDIYVDKKADTTLEEWAFEKRKRDFVDVFGILPRMIEM